MAVKVVHAWLLWHVSTATGRISATYLFSVKLLLPLILDHVLAISFEGRAAKEEVAPVAEDEVAPASEEGLATRG